MKHPGHVSEVVEVVKQSKDIAGFSELKSSYMYMVYILESIA